MAAGAAGRCAPPGERLSSRNRSGIHGRAEAIGIMLVIDGSLGEGGGQILRTSLALSLSQARRFASKTSARDERNRG